MLLTPRMGRPLASPIPATASDEKTTRHPLVDGPLGYVFAVFVTVVFLFLILKLWRADLSVPFHYNGDGMYYLRMIRNIIDTGWYLSDARVGQPGGLDFREFPASDGWLHLVVIKAIALIKPDAPFVYNVFYLLTFPLSTMSMLFLCRRVGVSYMPALVVSLLFTFLPFHFLRIGHLFLCSYYLVPISVFLMVRVLEGKLPFRDEADDAWQFLSWRAAGTLTAAIAIGLAGVYYSCFTLFFLGLAAVIRALQIHSWRPLVAVGLLMGLIAAAQAASLAPSMEYRMTTPRNGEAPKRHPQEAEMYPLKVSLLILPQANHRFGKFRSFMGTYLNATPINNENASSSLGLIGALGFLMLLARVFLLSTHPKRTWLDGMAMLTLAGVLLATMGGFGTFISWFLGPWLRAYNRISIFLACFSLVAVALLLQQIRVNWAVSPPRRFAFMGFLAILLLGGFYDQTAAKMAPPYTDLSSEWQADRAFVQAIEGPAKPGELLFMMPYRFFPEQVNHDMFRPYMHSRKLVFNYGSIHGHEGDMWTRWMLRLPPEEMVRKLAQMEAAGIWIEREGCPDKGTALEALMTKIVGSPPLVNATGKHAFFDLKPMRAALKQQCDEVAWNHRRDRIVHAICPLYRNGFDEEIGVANGGFGFWGDKSGEIHLVNRLPATRRLRLEMTIDREGSEGETTLRVNGPGWNESLSLPPAGRNISREIDVPPGRSVIRLECDGQPYPVAMPGPGQHLHVFRVSNVVCIEIE